MQQSPAKLACDRVRPVGVRMGGDAADAAFAQFVQGLGQAGGLHDRQLEYGAH